MRRFRFLICAFVCALAVRTVCAQGQDVYERQGYPPASGGGLPGGYESQQVPAAAPSYVPVRQPESGKPARGMSVSQWFHAYDQIRHQAQMSPSERQRADALLSRGFSVLMPGDEKDATRRLLSAMVTRYQRACQQLKQLPQLRQTSFLHHAYYNYFATAGQLFADYARVQDNVFAPDAATGQPLATGLIQRKQNLEGLEHECKQVDAQVRLQFGVAPYPW